MNNSVGRQELLDADYRKIFDSTYDAIFIETFDGSIVDVNEAACQLFQYTRDEFIGMNIAELLPLDDHATIRERMQQEVQEGQLFVTYNMRRDGKHIPVELRASRFYHKQQEYCLVILRDITERVEQQTELARQNAYLQSLHAITTGLLQQRELDELLEVLLTEVCALFMACDGHVSFITPDKRQWVQKAGAGRYAGRNGQTYPVRGGVVEQALASGNIQIIENYQEWPQRRYFGAYANIKTSVVIPLKHQDKMVAFIGLNYYEEYREFSLADIDTLTRFGELASIAFVNAKLYSDLADSEQLLLKKNEDLTAAHEELMANAEELQQQFLELMNNEEEIRRQNIVLSSLHDASIQVMKRLDCNAVLQMLLDNAANLLDTQHGWVCLIDKVREEFVVKAAKGRFARDIGMRFPLTQGLASLGYRTGEIMKLADYASWKGRLPLTHMEDVHTVLQVPLKIDEVVIGVFSVAFLAKPIGLTATEQERLIRLAEIAAIAIDNANVMESYKRELDERRAVEVILQRAEKTNRALINAIPDQMLMFDRHGIITEVKGSTDGQGSLPAPVWGMSVFGVFSQDLAEALLQAAEAAWTSGDISEFEYRTMLAGQEAYFEIRVVASGRQQVLAIIRNITHRKGMELKLAHLSWHDTLTGLYNRAYFEEQMQRFDGEDEYGSLLICDLDGLKIINDSFGHAAGDQALQAVATILKKAVSPLFCTARIGGDEFAVLMHNGSLVDCEYLCQAIRQQIDSYNLLNPTLPLSLSMGFAVKMQAEMSSKSLFQQADDHLYREKLHQQKSARSAIVQVLTTALEARDFITDGHGDRLQELMEDFSNQLNLPPSKIADLRLLAKFHDIGKVGIPDSILFKPGRLTEAEYAIMRRHSEIGYRIAQSAPDLSPIADWIFKHHEWWNGQGYPLGLVGKAIPLPCRMLGIADAYDAMTSDRPYRRALPPEQALEEIKRCMGKQFDPDLALVFISMIRRHKEL